MTNKNAIAKAEKRLLEDLRSWDVRVRREAARSLIATTESLLAALRDEYWLVRLEAARHSRATPEVLVVALRDTHAWVRCEAARHPNATPEVLMVAMGDGHEWVRRGGAENPNIKSLDLSTEKWLEFVAEGVFEGNLKNIPPHVKRDPRYKSIRLLSKLAH